MLSANSFDQEPKTYAPEYATWEITRALAEELHHEARLERITKILEVALEKAYGIGWEESRKYFCETP